MRRLVLALIPVFQNKRPGHAPKIGLFARQIALLCLLVLLQPFTYSWAASPPQIVVLGGSKGIGAAVAIQAAKQGWPSPIVIGRTPKSELPEAIQNYFNFYHIKYIQGDIFSKRDQPRLLKIYKRADAAVLTAESYPLHEGEVDELRNGLKVMYNTVLKAGVPVTRVGSPPAEVRPWESLNSAGRAKFAGVDEEDLPLELPPQYVDEDSKWQKLWEIVTTKVSVPYIEAKKVAVLAAQEFIKKGGRLKTALPTSVVNYLSHHGELEPFPPIYEYLSSRGDGIFSRLKLDGYNFSPPYSVDVVPLDVAAPGILRVVSAGKNGQKYQLSGESFPLARWTGASMEAAGLERYPNYTAYDESQFNLRNTVEDPEAASSLLRMARVRQSPEILQLGSALTGLMTPVRSSAKAKREIGYKTPPNMRREIEREIAKQVEFLRQNDGRLSCLQENLHLLFPGSK